MNTRCHWTHADLPTVHEEPHLFRIWNSDRGTTTGDVRSMP